ICLRLLRQLVRRAFSLARANTGNRIEARMEIMAMTTKSSINVKAWRGRGGRADCAGIFSPRAGQYSSIYPVAPRAKRHYRSVNGNIGRLFGGLAIAVAQRGR